MTGAELKTLRESLGLPVIWIAEHAENARLGGKGVERRTVERWESGERAVPDDVADLVLGVRGNWQAWVRQATDAAGEIIRQAQTDLGALPEDIVLYRYRSDEDLAAAHPDLAGMPATYHAAALARVKEHIEDAYDLDVVIEYAD